jgi:hypothetical protein
VAVYRDTDFKDATGTLDSHLLFRKQLDALWISDTRVTLTNTPSTNPVPPGAAVFLRQGTAAIAIRVPWTRGQDGTVSPVNLVDDGNPYGAARLTVSHAWLELSNSTSRVQAGVAFWLRTGSGIASEEAFATFKKAFTDSAAETAITPDSLRIQVSGLTRPLSISAQAPFTGDPATSPQPPRTVLGLDGKDVGRGVLETSSVIQAYLKTRRQAPPVAVASNTPTVWEAEQARFTVPYEIGATDTTASKGAFLWVPEMDGRSGGGSGRATYTLVLPTAGRYTLAGRVLTPTPDDDSFFLSVRAPDDREILPETAWSPGVFTTWTWREVSTSGKRGPATLDLPKGEVTLTLRPREAGSKLDQFRLTPVLEKR